MLRSMFTAIGGLKNHQVMLDTTANNIANVNTVGYKAERVSFETMMSQTLRGAGGPTTTGGTNPEEVGLGMTLGAIQTIQTQGSLQSTGQWSDLAIQGDGFFMVNDAVDTNTPPQAAGKMSYTRAGNFTLDQNGNLVTQGGNFVMGLQVVAAGPPEQLGTAPIALQVPTNAKSVSVSSTGLLSYVDTAGAKQVVGYVAMAKFPNPAGLNREGENLLTESANSGVFDPTLAPNTPASTAGDAVWGTANQVGLGSIAPAALEMSNVDLAQEFTNMITAQRGFQANSRAITTSDEMLQELVNLKR